MATFPHHLEQFKMNLARRNDEWDARDMLLQNIGAQVKEVEDLKTREVLPERTESDHGKSPKASEAKGVGECRDTGDTRGSNQSPTPLTKDKTLTTLHLCEEVKYGKVGSLEKEDLSESEIDKSQSMIEQLPKRGKHCSIKHKAKKEPERTRKRPATWRYVRVCRGGHAHSTVRAQRENFLHSELAGVHTQRGEALGASAEVKADCGSKARGSLGMKARQNVQKAMQIGSSLARNEGIDTLGRGE